MKGDMKEMLIGFKVKNFRSFDELQHFSMIAGKVRNNEDHIIQCNKYKVLKFSSLFGANGSGKSNLILAMSLLQSIVNYGVGSLIDNQYFRGDKIKSNESSYFEYELFINNKLFSYGFEISFLNQKIVSEWLIDMTKQNEKVIYERDILNGSYNTDIKVRNEYFNICLNEMKNNSSDLFLKEMMRRLAMSDNNDSFFDDIRNVFKYLIFDTVIIRPSTHKLIDINYISNKEKILKYLNALDINICDIVAIDYEINNLKSKLSLNDFNKIMEDFNILSNKFKDFSCCLRIENDLYLLKKEKNAQIIVQSLKFKHNNSESEFGAFDESDGTIRILELIDILLSNNKLFLIDELDSSLHPSLVSGLLEIFLKLNINNQLIITTHELKTLDFSLVRRDEIWFTEKNDNGESRLYSLEEFKDIARFDRKIDKAYLEGRFGGIANINTNI